MLGVLGPSVRGRDAEAERTGTYSQRLGQRTPAPTNAMKLDPPLPLER